VGKKPIDAGEDERRQTRRRAAMANRRAERNASRIRVARSWVAGWAACLQQSMSAAIRGQCGALARESAKLYQLKIM
jgi:hypothetical protein